MQLINLLPLEEDWRRLANFGFPLWPSSTCLTTPSSFEDQAEDAHVLSQEESQTLLACYNDFQDLVAENFEIEDKKDSLFAFEIGGSSQLALKAELEKKECLCVVSGLLRRL